MIKKLVAAFLLLSSTVAIAQIDPYTIHRGKVHLSGKFVSSNPETAPVPKLTVFYLRDMFLKQDMNTQVDIAADGTFAADIAVPHPLFTWTNDFDGKVFFLPGDTLVLEADVATKQLKIERSDAAKRLSDIEDKNESLMAGLPRGWQSSSWQVPQLQAYVDTVMTRIDNYLSVNHTPEYTDTISPQQKLVNEILRLAPVSHALSEAVMARMYYDVPDTATVKPDYSLISRVMAKYPKQITDNPAVVLCSEDADMILNYIEYREYRPLLNIFEPWIFPQDYNAKAHALYLKEKPDDYIAACNKALTKIEKASGLQRDCLLSQIILTRYLSDDMREQFVVSSEPLLNDARAAMFSSVMRYFTHPTAALAIVNQYRDLVKKSEGGVSAVNNIPPVLAEIIKPYQGRVLYIDFWGMGCGPCRAGMLAQREIVKKMEGKPVNFLYVANEKDSPREPSEKWLQKNNIKGEHIFISAEQWKELTAALNFLAIPFSIYVNPAQNCWEKPVYDIETELTQRIENMK